MRGRARILCLALMALVAAGGCAVLRRGGVKAPAETPDQFAERTAWWREAKFGMFIHWGVYAIPADGEWHQNRHKMQVPDYEKFAPQFNPVNFDAAKWVQTAKDAGMKYIVITSKHHDGFCMFDTKLTSYSVVRATPFGRDPMKELAAECQRQGINLCFYYSIMDWHHPDYAPRRAWETETRPATSGSLPLYIEYMRGQLRELLTNYGPIGIIWFDGGWEHKPDEMRAQETVAMMRSLQPGIIINNRAKLPEDYDTPEQTIPAEALKNDRLWETCMTLNRHWGYCRDDNSWKSPEDLVHKLCDIASKGGNFLLNVGPTELGEIPQESIARLARVGQWMKTNGESVYGTTKGPYRRAPFDGRITSKGDTLFLQVFRWPEGGLKMKGLKTKVLEARALDGGEVLAVRPAAEGAMIAKPSKRDELATVVALRLAGRAEVDEPEYVVTPQADGRIVLLATDAAIHGEKAKLESKGKTPNIGYWVSKTDTLSWRVSVTTAGAYRAQVEYACASHAAGSEYVIALDGNDQKIGATVGDTGGWDKFRSEALDGVLRLAAGEHTLRVMPQTMPHGAVMNLRRVTLAPEK